MKLTPKDEDLDSLKSNIINDALSTSDTGDATPSSVDDAGQIADNSNITDSTEDLSVDASTPQTPTVPPTDSTSTFSFGDLEDDIVPETTPNPETTPLLQTSDEQSDNDVDLSKMAVEEAEEKNESTHFDFDDTEDDDAPKSFTDKLKGLAGFRISGHSFTFYIIFTVLFLIGFLGSIIFYYLREYVIVRTQPADQLSSVERTVLERVDGYYQTAMNRGLLSDGTIGYERLSFEGSADADWLDNVIASQDTMYIERYDLINAYTAILKRQAPTIYESYITSKQELASYPFFPTILQGLMDVNQDASLQRSILSLEAARFRTAIAVYSRFETFMRQFSLFSGRDRLEVDESVEQFIARGDVDIEYYLSTCYLNPFETSDTCSSVGDFERMYAYYLPDDDFDTTFYASFMNFIDDKLEDTLLPSLSLVVKDFDPIQQHIALEIQVNTFPEDQLQLLNNGILNPHVYVIGTMINFLRQSKFIVSENIRISELNIEKNSYSVGSREIIVSSTDFEFELPLQKGTQREITDFFIVTSGVNLSVDESSDDNDMEVDLPFSGAGDVSISTETISSESSTFSNDNVEVSDTIDASINVSDRTNSDSVETSDSIPGLF